MAFHTQAIFSVFSHYHSGTTPIPWLGNLTHLAPTEDFPLPPYGDDDSKSPFPVRPSERRSYAQNCVVWLKQTGIQVVKQLFIFSLTLVKAKYLFSCVNGVNFYMHIIDF